MAIPSLSELRKLAICVQAPAALSEPISDKTNLTVADRRIVAGRFAVLETCIGVIAIEILIAIVIAVYEHALASALLRIPVHLAFLCMLCAGMRGAQTIYGVFLVAMGVVSLLQLSSARDNLLNATDTVFGGLALVIGYGIITSRDIAAFVLSRRKVAAPDYPDN